MQLQYKPDWEQAQDRMSAWWRGEDSERVALQVFAPLERAGKQPPTAPESLEKRYTDIDYVMERRLYDFEHTYYGAEAFPCFWPNFGPDFMGAVLGARLEFGENTSWAVPCLDTLEGVQLHLKEDNPYWCAMQHLSEVVAQNAPGRYVYGLTDLHPSLDTLCALRGAGNLMMDLVDEPEAVDRALAQVMQVFDQLYERLLAIGRQSQPQGSTTTLEVFSQGRYYAHVCDVIYMISPAMFERFACPSIEHELSMLDESIFHVDGVGSLRHLDRILEFSKLKAVQWVYGDGQPSARHWISVYQRIQQAGKLVYTYGPPEDLEALLAELDPNRLMYVTFCESKEQAEELIRLAKRWSFHKRIY